MNFRCNLKMLLAISGLLGSVSIFAAPITTEKRLLQASRLLYKDCIFSIKIGSWLVIIQEPAVPQDTKAMIILNNRLACY